MGLCLYIPRDLYSNHLINQFETLLEIWSEIKQMSHKSDHYVFQYSDAKLILNHLKTRQILTIWILDLSGIRIPTILSVNVFQKKIYLQVNIFYSRSANQWKGTLTIDVTQIGGLIFLWHFVTRRFVRSICTHKTPLQIQVSSLFYLMHLLYH